MENEKVVDVETIEVIENQNDNKNNNKSKKKESKFFGVLKGIAFALISIICNLGVSIAGSAIIAILMIIKLKNNNPALSLTEINNYMNDNYMSQVYKYAYHMTALYMLICAIIIFIIFKLFKRPIKNYINLKKTKISAILVSIPLGLSMSVALGNIIYVISTKIKLPGYDEMMDISDLNENTYIIGFFTIVILAPIFEELLFRGIILTSLKKSISIKLAIIIQALLFGIYHLNVTQGIYAFIIGCVFGIIVIWFNSIWLSICMHMGINFLSILGDIMDEGSTEVIAINESLITIFVSTIIFCLSFLAIKKISIRKKPCD